MDRRRGAKIAYVKEKRSVSFTTKEIPPALTRLNNPPVKEHRLRKRYKEREQHYEKQKNTPTRVSDRLANKNGFHRDVYWVTGDLYRGNWKCNKKDGSGIHSYCTGNRYEGDWKDGKREGYGTFFIQEDGKYRVVYKGYWKAGNLHGPGYLYCAYGEIYEGDFESGMRSGYGKQTYWCSKTRCYDVYVGQWHLDKREGMGTLVMVNGDVYEGSFSNDMKNGKGVFYYTSRNCKYEGLWKEDVAICGTYLKLEEDYELNPLPHLELRNSERFAEDLIEQILRDDEIQNASDERSCSTSGR